MANGLNRRTVLFDVLEFLQSAHNNKRVDLAQYVALGEKTVGTALSINSKFTQTTCNKYHRQLTKGRRSLLLAKCLSVASAGFVYIVQHNQAKPMWRNGRRNGLKIRWAEKARAGSNPAIGKSQKLDKIYRINSIKEDLDHLTEFNFVTFY